MIQARPTPTPFSLSTPGQNLVRLTIIRGISWTGFLGVVIFGIELLQFHLHVDYVIGTILFVAIVNVITWWRLGRRYPVTDIEYVSHLLLDTLGLTVLFYFTGGATNPAVTYLMVPITIAAATMRQIHAVVVTVVAILAYLFLLFHFQPLPELSIVYDGMPFDIHIMGMALTFLLCACLVMFFITRMAIALRKRDQVLAKTREAALRSEQVMAVASQAAGTAHELGTPLSTIALLASEMRLDLKDHPELLQDVDLIRQQVDTCKKHLRTLAASAQREASAVQRVNAREWFNSVINRWLVMRHDVDYTFDSEKGRSPDIDIDTTLDQAILNLLNNAADADPGNIELRLDWAAGEVHFEIRDHGPGIPLDIADELGETFVSTHSKGMGIGLFLTHSTLERFGGSVKLYNHSEGGAITAVTLPIAGRS